MQCLTTKSGPKTREIFDATLHDDGHRSALPVCASIINDYWLRIGSDDMRQILGTRGLDDQTTFYVTSGRLNAAAQARATARGGRGAAGRQLQVALGKLDPADRTPATMLTRALSRWLDARA